MADPSNKDHWLLESDWSILCNTSVQPSCILYKVLAAPEFQHQFQRFVFCITHKHLWLVCRLQHENNKWNVIHLFNLTHLIRLALQKISVLINYQYVDIYLNVAVIMKRRWLCVLEENQNQYSWIRFFFFFFNTGLCIDYQTDVFNNTCRQSLLVSLHV